MINEKIILGLSVAVGLITFMLITLVGNFEFVSIGYALVATAIITIFPYSTIIYLRVRTAKKMEDYFPAFLSDIAEGKRAGMTIPHAIELSASTDYGPLSKEIKKMNYLISWGIPLPDTLKMVSEHAKYSKYIQRGLAILLESYYTGGKIAETMDAIASSTRKLKEVEKDRESVLQQQMIIVYLIHFIFIGILIALYNIMIPMLNMQTMGGAMIGGGSDEQMPSIGFYKVLFFLTMTIQSFCNGLVAGVTKEGAVSAGVKHSGIMVAVALVAYVIFIMPEAFTLNAVSSKIDAVRGEEIEFYGSLTLENQPVSNATIKVTYGGVTNQGLTNQYGEFSVKVNSPLTAGVYPAKIEAIYNEYYSTSEIQITVS